MLCVILSWKKSNSQLFWKKKGGGKEGRGWRHSQHVALWACLFRNRFCLTFFFFLFHSNFFFVFFFIFSLIACWCEEGERERWKKITLTMVNINRFSCWKGWKWEMEKARKATRKHFLFKQASGFRKAYYLWLMISCVNFFFFFLSFFFPNFLAIYFFFSFSYAREFLRLIPQRFEFSAKLLYEYSNTGWILIEFPTHSLTHFPHDFNPVLIPFLSSRFPSIVF